VNFPGYIKKLRYFCIIIYIFFFLFQGFAQKIPVTQLPSDQHTQAEMQANYFEKESTVGSVYLSVRWMPGSIEFSNHRKFPLPDHTIFCNFDKVKSILYVLTDKNGILSYPVDSVLNFELVGNNKDYRFEKVSWISSNYFLMPVIVSEKGYSLYKRLFTKLNQADYSNGGYYVKGKKFDEYVDYYEYYITNPGNSSYQKVPLKESSIRRALKNESQLLREFFELHDNEITEESLLGIIQYINDKKYPD
jgi:hypothetical protein